MTSTQKTLLVLALFVIPVGLFVLFHGFTAHANAYNLYASRCDGGWQHPEYALGRSPTVGTLDDYTLTDTNAAVAPGTTAAQITCAGFHGDIVAANAPKKITVRFLWTANYPQEEERPVSDTTTTLVATGTTADGPTTVVGSIDGVATGTSAQLLIVDASSSGTTTQSASASTGGGGAAASMPASSATSDMPAAPAAVPAPAAPEPVPAAPSAPASDTSTPAPTAPAAPASGTPASAASAPSPATASDPTPSPAPAAGPAPVSAPTSAPVPAPASDSPAPVSFLNFFGTLAFADEVTGVVTSSPEISSSPVATATTPIPEGTTTAANSGATMATSSTSATDTTMVNDSSGVVEVLYAVDGLHWKSLGFVAKGDFATRSFEIPLADAPDWEGIGKIEIAIRSVPSTDGIAPIVRLGAVWLEVAYEDQMKEKDPTPAPWRGDVIIGEADYGTQAAVLVARPMDVDGGAVQDSASTSAHFADVAPSSTTTSPSGVDVATNSATSLFATATSLETANSVATVTATTVGDPVDLVSSTSASTSQVSVASGSAAQDPSAAIATSSVYELWLRDDTNGTTTPLWTLITSDGLSSTTQVYFRNGNIFWLANGVFDRFNPGSHGYDSVSLVASSTVTMEYPDEASLMHQVLISGQGDVVFDAPPPEDSSQLVN